MTMRDTPRLGTVMASSKWHFGREDNFHIEAYCGKRFVPGTLGWKYNDWIYGDGTDLNACAECAGAWEIRNEEITELNSMFNLESARLAPAGPDTGFLDWIAGEASDYS